MTVETTNISSTAIADGVEITFSFDFQALDPAWVQATETLTSGSVVSRTDITVFLNADQNNSPGGTCTFATAPANLSTVTMFRDIPLTQETDYTNNDAFPAESHEDSLDKLTMLIQQLQAGDQGFNLNPVFNSINMENTVDPAANGRLLMTYGELFGSPWMTFQPAAGRTSQYTFRVDNRSGLEKDISLASTGHVVVAAGLAITDPTHLTSKEYVDSVVAGGSPDPTFNTVSISHETDIPTFGAVQGKYHNVFTLTEAVDYTFPTAAAGVAQAFVWRTLDTSNVEYAFQFLNDQMLLPAGADPTAADSVTRKAWVDNTFLRIDGATAMSGALSMGGNQVKGVAAPTASDDAARKADVDAVASPVHAKGVIDSDGAGGQSIANTKNISSITISGSGFRVVMSSALASARQVITLGVNGSGGLVQTSIHYTKINDTTFDIFVTAADTPITTSAVEISFRVEDATL
jgi:hypothetical protein